MGVLSGAGRSWVLPSECLVFLAESQVIVMLADAGGVVGFDQCASDSTSVLLRMMCVMVSRRQGAWTSCRSGAWSVRALLSSSG